jgi:hypothetical protein
MRIRLATVLSVTLTSTLISLVVTGTARADLILTMGGDVNFNKSGFAPDARGAVIDGNGKALDFSTIISRVAPLLTPGHLNFANVETAVSDDPRLPRVSKAFDFLSHPNGVWRMVEAGFNLFSLANNHAYDRGFEGMTETLRHFQKIEASRPRKAPIAYAGIGVGPEGAAQPAILDINGYRIAFASIGIMDERFRATEGKIGMLNYHRKSDWHLQLNALKAVQGVDLKILSIHYGTEMQARLDEGQRGKYHYALEHGDADIIIGHHPHVARPVEMVGDKVIFYSLGNYMMIGAANLDSRHTGWDFGLFARVHYRREASHERLKARAIELVPLKGMHRVAYPLSGASAAWRVGFLNSLGQHELGGSSHRGNAVDFKVTSQGTGLFCKYMTKARSGSAPDVCDASLPLVRPPTDARYMPQCELVKSKDVRYPLVMPECMRGI